MQTKFIEATNKTKDSPGINWGKFMVARFDMDEWMRPERVDKGASLLASRGWDKDHILVLDLQTGEGAIFRPGGMAKADLGDKHQIWVCPLFEPFLEWLYGQDLREISKLPGVVELPGAPSALYGYRRERKGVKR